MNRYLKLAALALIPAGSATFLHAQTKWNEIPLDEGIYQASDTPFRQNTYEIPVPAQSALEFKLAIEEGDNVVYEWAAAGGQPGLLSTEFHGHTEPVDNQGDLMFYKVHTEPSERGVLKAPFSGIHGWYLNNESDEDVLVTLNVAGFYTEIPGQL